MWWRAHVTILPCARQHCLVKSTPRASLGERGSTFPRAFLCFSKKRTVKIRGWFFARDRQWLCLYLHKAHVEFCVLWGEGSVLVRSGKVLSLGWLLRFFFLIQVYTSFGAVDKKWPGQYGSSSPLVLKQKGCDVVLTQTWETGQEQGQVMQTGFCGPGKTSGIPSGIADSLLFCRSNHCGSVDANTVTAVSSRVTGSWILHHIFPVIGQK